MSTELKSEEGGAQHSNNTGEVNPQNTYRYNPRHSVDDENVGVMRTLTEKEVEALKAQGPQMPDSVPREAPPVGPAVDPWAEVRNVAPTVNGNGLNLKYSHRSLLPPVRHDSDRTGLVARGKQADPWSDVPPAAESPGGKK